MALISKVEEPSYRKRVGYQAGLLAGCCMLVGILIIAGDNVTRASIIENLRQDKLMMLEQVLPAELYNNDLLESTRNIAPPREKNAEKVVYSGMLDDSYKGFAFESVGQGYSGDIRLIIGLNPTGQILGVRVISHAETPGLGDKIEIAKDDWITTFNHLSLENTPERAWAVKKDGGDFDQFTGATITPRAVVKAVHAALVFYSKTQAQLRVKKTEVIPHE